MLSPRQAFCVATWAGENAQEAPRLEANLAMEMAVASSARQPCGVRERAALKPCSHEKPRARVLLLLRLTLPACVTRLAPPACTQLEARQPGAQASSSGEGHADERGTVAGRLTAARAFLSPSFEALFRGPQQHHGVPSVLTKYRGMVAVGTSAGSVHVLMPAGKRDSQG